MDQKVLYNSGITSIDDISDPILRECFDNFTVTQCVCGEMTGDCFMYNGRLWVYYDENMGCVYDLDKKQMAMSYGRFMDSSIGNFETYARGYNICGTVEYSGSTYSLWNTQGGIPVLVRLKGAWETDTTDESTRAYDVIYNDHSSKVKRLIPIGSTENKVLVTEKNQNSANEYKLGYSAQLLVYNNKLVIASMYGVYEVNPSNGILTYLFDPPVYSNYGFYGDIYRDVTTKDKFTPDISYAVCGGSLYYMDVIYGLWVYNSGRWNKLCDLNASNTGSYDWHRLTVINDTLFTIIDYKIHYFNGTMFVPYDIETDEKDTYVKKLFYDSGNNTTYVFQGTNYSKDDNNVYAISTIKEEEIIMPTNVRKNATFTTMINDVLTDIMLKTSAAQVEVSDGVTLADKLSEIATALTNKAGSEHTHLTSDVTGLDDALTARPTTEAMNTAIKASIDELVNGAPEAYDTLKEIADYIEAHKDVATAINEAIGKKADAETVTALQELVNTIKTTVDSLGALASKDKVSTADLDEALGAKVTDLETKAHTHINGTLLGLININKYGLNTKDYPSNVGKTFKAAIDGANNEAQEISLDYTSAGMGIARDAKEHYYTTLASMGTVNDVSKLLDADIAAVSDKVTALESSSPKTYYSATQPDGLKNGDMWYQLID